MRKPPNACYYLQNKAWFMHPPIDETGEPRDLATPCWCLKTHEPVGPDGELACPEECHEKRACYKAEVAL